MRTFLSHDATARCSETGEKRRSEMLSSGGEDNSTSLEMSPVVLVVVEAAEEAAEPKSVDMAANGKTRGNQALGRLLWPKGK